MLTHICLQAYLDRRAAAGRVTSQTLKTWDSMLKLAHKALGDIPLEKLTRHDLDKAMAKLRKEGYAERTAQGVYDFLRLCLNDAVEQGLIPKSPLRAVERPKTPPRRNLNMPTDILATLLSCAHHDPAGPALRLALATGFRRAELARLKWEDWDFLRKTVTVQKGKTPSAKRTVAVPDMVVKEFILRRQNSHTDYCFPNSTGGAIDPNLLSMQVKSLMRRANVPEHFSLHSLRHTHASRLLNAGMSLPNVSARLGHASPNVTLGIYGHATQEDDRALAAEIEKVMS